MPIRSPNGECWSGILACPFPLRLPVSAPLRSISIASVIFVTFLAAGLCPCVAEENASRTNLAIGLLLPPDEPEVGSLREGAALGVELANQWPGPHFTLVARGRAGQWGSDGVEAAGLVTEDGVQGLIAPPDGSASHLVLQVSGRTAVPVISLCADSSVSQTGVPWMARIVPRTVEEAKLLFARIGAKRWAVAVAEDRAGRETARDLRAAAAQGGRVIGNIIATKLSGMNMRQTAKRLLKDQPEGVLLWLDSATAARMANALRQVGFTGTLAGPGRLQSEGFLRAAGEAGDGFLVAGLPRHTQAEAEHQRFASVFRSRCGHDPNPTALMSYDAVALLTAILRQCGARAPRELFPLTFPVCGASGILVFDALGNRQVNLQLYRAHNGRFIVADRGQQTAEGNGE